MKSLFTFVTIFPIVSYEYMRDFTAESGEVCKEGLCYLMPVNESCSSVH